MQAPTRVIKIVVVGSSQSGKTKLMQRYAEDKWSNEEYLSTIGVDFRVKTIDLQGNLFKLQIWDTAGQTRFKTITNAYYKGATIIFVVFDLTNLASFAAAIREIVQFCKNQYCNNQCSVLLIGSKLDLGHQRVVSFDEANQLGKIVGEYIEVSAYTNENVTRAFQTAVRNHLRCEKGAGGQKRFVQRMNQNKNHPIFTKYSHIKQQEEKIQPLQPNPNYNVFMHHQEPAYQATYAPQYEVSPTDINAPQIIAQPQQKIQQPITIIKSILLGYRDSGKSTVLTNYVDNVVYQSYIPTIGVDFKTKTEKIQNQSYKLQIWDTAGQQRYKTITQAYHKGSRLAFVFYDVTNMNTFQQAKEFITKTRELNESADMYICLVGNKIDLEGRVVSTEMGMKLAQDQKIDFVQISGKNHQQVQCMFRRGVNHFHTHNSQPQ